MLLYKMKDGRKGKREIGKLKNFIRLVAFSSTFSLYPKFNTTLTLTVWGYIMVTIFKEDPLRKGKLKN